MLSCTHFHQFRYKLSIYVIASFYVITRIFYFFLFVALYLKRHLTTKSVKCSLYSRLQSLDWVGVFRENCIIKTPLISFLNHANTLITINTYLNRWKTWISNRFVRIHYKFKINPKKTLYSDSPFQLSEIHES